MKDLTPKEIQDLERQKCEASVRCKECWKTLQQLDKITRNYLNTYSRWKKRFEEADRALAEIDGRLTIVNVKGKKGKSIFDIMTKEQLFELVKEIEESE